MIVSLSIQTGGRRPARHGLPVLLRTVQPGVQRTAQPQLDEGTQEPQDSVHCQPQPHRDAHRSNAGNLSYL